MKILNTVLVSIFVTIPTGCFDMSDALSGNGEYLSNKRGLVSDCRGRLLSMEAPPTDADLFWQNNNLPKGTADFVCKDGKAYLPNKVTDCQGNIIAKQPGGIAQFKLNNNFPRYPTSGKIVRYTAFNCEGSQVVPIDHTKK